MKIKHEISSNPQFFTEIYDKADEIMKMEFPYKELNITINNIPTTDALLNKDYPEIGYMRWTAKFTKKQYHPKYTIDLAELISLDFRNTDMVRLMMDRYKIYLESFGLSACAEAITVATLLHELGHIVLMEHFGKYFDDYEYLKVFQSYEAMCEHAFIAVFKPWDCSFSAMNMARVNFMCTETTAESFVFKYYPHFVGILKKYGFILTE